VNGNNSILLICDDKRTADDLSGYLAFEGKAEVRVAASGHEGLEMLRQKDYDLVVG